MINKDALIKVRFLTPQEGGRNHDIVGEKYGCPLMINDEGFDCRFVLDTEKHFILGETYNINIKFLNPYHAGKVLKEGQKITLWEGKTIATGKIVTLDL